MPGGSPDELLGRAEGEEVRAEFAVAAFLEVAVVRRKVRVLTEMPNYVAQGDLRVVRQSHTTVFAAV
ncbi:MAG TPA: hypothetical protein VGR43_08810 [Dehalococcoidia bacterium]|jgi:hypothetical protein|nr:hypothetical protein [Dehalococcoidia bacterium]